MRRLTTLHLLLRAVSGLAHAMAGAGGDHGLEIASNSPVRILVLVVMQSSTALVVPVPPVQLMGTSPLQSASRKATQVRWLARSAFSQLTLS